MLHCFLCCSRFHFFIHKLRKKCWLNKRLGRTVSEMSYYTHTHTHNRLAAFCPVLPGLAGTRRNTHPHPSKPSDIPHHPPPSTTIHGIPFAQSTSSTTPLQVLPPDPQPHTPRISSPNHHHPLAAHAHTNAARSAATPMARHPHHIVGLKTINSVLSNETDWLLIGHNN